jgi:nitrate reductase delta subunit
MLKQKLMSDTYEQLAGLLEYPDAKWDTKMTGDLVNEFESSIGPLSLSELQELYTRTFDLNPACALEVGYHLFGENYKRGEFLANLRETEAPFELGQAQQLPDYLPVLLRLLPKLDDQELRSSLIAECLIPGIEKMLGSLKETDNPYRSLLAAVRSTLQTEAPAPSIEPAHFNRRANLPVINALSMETKPGMF